MAAEDHPLDIRLRADLLGKRLLFLGYSFRDENVAKLLDSVKRVFRGNLPPSYLIAFDDEPRMQDLANAYGIQVINPLRFYPEAKDSAEAFERLPERIVRPYLEASVGTGTRRPVFQP
jgi:hypothetical protein